MDLVFENSPQACTALGLDCGTCIHQAAASVAAVCQALDSIGVQQIFFQIFTSPACRPMAHAFALAYEEASSAAKPHVAYATAVA
jgi:hypothetical protein